MIASGNCRKIFIILGINKGVCKQKKSCVEVLSVKIVGNIYLFININQFFVNSFLGAKLKTLPQIKDELL